METTAIVPSESSAFMPALSIQNAIDRRNTIVQFVNAVMVKDVDYGKVPGTDKDTLLKAGAEKLNTLFGLSAKFIALEQVNDWTGKDHGGEPFFFIRYSCILSRGSLQIAEGIGSCNSQEKKYRYRWVPEHEARRVGVDIATAPRQGGRASEFSFSIEKAETTGKYGKPAEYWQAFKTAIENGTATKTKKKTREGKEFDAWEIDSTMFRVPNPDVADAVNTIDKMAQKRALVAATLLAVNASEFFTQDVEDMDIIDGTAYEVKRTTEGAGSTNGKPTEPLPWDTAPLTNAAFAAILSNALKSTPKHDAPAQGNAGLKDALQATVEQCAPRGIGTKWEPAKSPTGLDVLKRIYALLAACEQFDANIPEQA